MICGKCRREGGRPILATVTDTKGHSETAVLKAGLLCPHCLGGFVRLAEAKMLPDPDLASIRFALLPPGAEA